VTLCLSHRWSVQGTTEQINVLSGLVTPGHQRKNVIDGVCISHGKGQEWFDVAFAILLWPLLLLLVLCYGLR